MTAPRDWSRRRFLATSGAAAAFLAACTSGSDAAGRPVRRARPDASGIASADLPTEEQIFGWIERIVGRGVRRPGYPADVWAEGWIEQQFRRLGLHDVRREPVPVKKWEPGSSSLTVTTAAGTTRRLQHFPVPFSAPTAGLDLELTAWDASDPGAAAGRALLYPVELITLPATALATSGSAPKDMRGRIVDDAQGSLAHGMHTVPFATDFQNVLGNATRAGAAAFVGTVTDPGGTHEYFVPYDAKPGAIPGVYVSGDDGRWLRDQLASGPVRVRLSVGSRTTPHTSYNVMGDLPGADDEMVVIGSHHDGPWASAVEDASGTSLVLAQAHYWSRRPRSERPHRLRFLLQAGHMSGGAGNAAYVTDPTHELDRVVLEVHLEHAALEATRAAGGKVEATDLPVPRWFFTSRHASLETAVAAVLREEALTRSMLLAPDAFGAAPPTDGAGFHLAGVPVVHFLAAPWYLFDSVDTPDKIDRAHLVPLTRAAARIVRFTEGKTAAGLRADPPTP